MQMSFFNLDDPLLEELKKRFCLDIIPSPMEAFDELNEIKECY
jgi:hypothetical protein